MLAQGWPIVDRYRNTTRDNMPEDETITSFADRLIELAEQVITHGGGQRTVKDGRVSFVIVTESPRPVLKLVSADPQQTELVAGLSKQITEDLTTGTTVTDWARASYLAICLDMAASLQLDHPDEWQRGVKALEDQQRVLQVLFHHSAVPAADGLRQRFIEAGVAAPPERIQLW